MEFVSSITKKHLDFNRPTFNESSFQLPNVPPRLPGGSLADDELSITTVDPETTEPSQIESVNVHLRIKPVREPCGLYKFTDETVMIPQGLQNAEKHFKFTSVLSEDVKQSSVYDKIVRETLASPFEIRGGTFTSYGISGSGKTFTILGDASAGLLPRAITQIFTEFSGVVSSFPCAKIVYDQIQLLDDSMGHKEMENTQDFLVTSNKLMRGKSHVNPWFHDEIKIEHDFKEVDTNVLRLYVWISFVEIYNEKLTDLLETDASKNKLRIMSNGGNSYIHGLKWLFVPNIETAFNIMRYGLAKIRYASTGMNEHSSRSHTILTINLIAEYEDMEYQFSSFKFCDLAGAERSKKTGTVGDRLKEAGGINKSLLVLGRCLEAVQNNQSRGTGRKAPDHVVPVRESKLTLLLQSSLQGHEKFVMIVNLCPTADYFEENQNVLNFGSIASQIVVKKSELRKFRRVSYFKNTQLNGSIRTDTVNQSVIRETSFENGNESELDESYIWSSMSQEALIRELRTQKTYLNELKRMYLATEETHAEDRKKILESQRAIQERAVKRIEVDLKIQKEYYEKKLENLKISTDRKLGEAYDYIDKLEKKLRKYEGDKVEEESDDDETDEEDDDDDDVIEIDE